MEEVGQQITVDSAAVQGEASRFIPFEERYALSGELARGGMGRVVSAMDRSIGREVAIKESLHKSDRSLVRFMRESLMTARLQHPSIIPVYEVGKRKTGEPYIVMRLVHGKPLSELIDDAKTLEARMRLLPSALAVIDALAYAHQRDIIHRDLKPSNVLVGQFGETVVIDWGLAKDLGAPDRDDSPLPNMPGQTSGELTLDGAVIGTPSYMSPEQAQGVPADKRSDVYALGALLYQLLSGHTPFDQIATMDVLQQVVHREPIPLEHHQPELPADLLTIVRTAMEHDADDRYPSAGELAEELRRFQLGQLVSTHRYSVFALILRWARKHKAVLAVAAIALCLMAVFGALSLREIIAERDRANHEADLANMQTERANHEAGLAKKERDRANREAESAKRVAQFLSGMFKVADPSESRGNTVSAREVLDRASKQIDEELKTEPAVKVQLMGVMGDTYADLGLFEQADKLLRRAVAIGEEKLGANDPKTLAVKHTLGILCYQQGKFPDAEKYMREVLVQYQKTLGEDARETINAKSNLGNVLDDIGRYSEAAALMADGFERRTRVFGADDPDTLLAAGNLISAYVHEDREDLALPHARSVLEREERVFGKDHPNTIMVREELAQLLDDRRDFVAAEKIARENIEIEKKVFAPEHPAMLSGQSVLAEILEDEGHTVEAEALFRRVVAISERVEPDNPDVWVAQTHLGAVLAKNHKFDEAEKLLLRVFEARARSTGDDNPTTINTMHELGVAYYQHKKFRDSLIWLERAAAAGRKLGADRHDTASSAVALAGTHLALGNTDECLSLLREAVSGGLAIDELKDLGDESTLKPLVNDPRFKQIVADAKAKAAKLEQERKANKQ